MCVRGRCEVRRGWSEYSVEWGQWEVIHIQSDKHTQSDTHTYRMVHTHSDTDIQSDTLYTA